MKIIRASEHLENGGTAYVTKNDFIVEMVGEESYDVVNPRDIPVTLGGTADFQTANSMAAIAACRAFGISREQIVSRLQTFRTDADNPGRNNLYKVGKGYALVDYGHNPDGFAAICRMVSKWKGKKSPELSISRATATTASSKKPPKSPPVAFSA
jgi:cyanophycin synthetase